MSTEQDLAKYSYGVEYSPHTSTAVRAPDGVKYVRVQWVDFINNVRYRVLPRAYFLKVLQASRPGITVPKVAFGIVFLATAPGFSGSGENLYIPDLSSYRLCTYAPGHASIMGWFQEKMPSPSGGLSVPLCPRSLLARITQYAKEKAGVSFLVGVESEFILLKETSPKIVEVNHGDWSCSSKFPSGTVEATVMEEIADNLQNAGIELQMYHAEAAPGQYELATGPLTPLEAADALVFTRETIYNTASKHGLRATFAPRIHLDSCGSAAHTHISVHSEKPQQTSETENPLAPALNSIEQSFLEGLLSHLPAVCALTLPTTYSYVRVLDGIWSGGTYVCWGTDNRETPVRVCGSSSIKASSRPHFEVKCVDATSSPYLAFAAMIAAGTSGITEGKKLSSGDCSAKPVALMSVEERKKLGVDGAARLPKTIADARKLLVEDKTLTGLLGEEFVEGYRSVNETLEKLLKADTEEATVTKLVNFY
ncbi:FLU1-II [Panus rudis PR-1116 ss-1]|nr:FLU1-II [Panus rudis PR-1116 ss-1]